MEEHCIVCGQQKPTHKGIHILMEFICDSCETEMVQTEVKDEKYPVFIEKLKRICLHNQL